MCFDNPIESLEYLIENFGNCSLVITDYKMPQMSGIDFIKKLREFNNNYIIKVILITAYIIKSILIDQNNKLKIHKVIGKPISIKVLETEVKMLIDES